MDVLVTCKNEEDPFKNEGARVVTTMLHYPSIFKMLKGRSLIVSLCRFFYDAQGKLTPQSEVGSTLNSNSAKLLWLSLLPARTKKIQSKMKVLE